MIAYFNGKFLKKEEICLSPDDRGFLFADGLYEVVRFYNGKPFCLYEHQKRLEKGARALRLNRTQFPEFSKVNLELIQRNDLHSAESAIVYFQVTRGAAPRSHRFSPATTPLTVYAFARAFKSAEQEQQKGAKAILVEDQRWANCHLKTIALLPNILAHQQARDAGAVEALFVRDGFVQEGTHSNVMLVKENQLFTPPLTTFVLPGVTRKQILNLCAQLGITVHERPISVRTLLEADEVMIVGTTVEITPIVQIDKHEIGGGKPGKITRKLQKEFQRLVES